jgi:hypothetical protein
LHIQDDKLRDFFRSHSNAVTVTSDVCGVGKSRHIEVAMRSDLQYERVILSGDMTATKFIQLHREKALDILLESGIHYDVYPTTQLTMLVF